MRRLRPLAVLARHARRKDLTKKKNVRATQHSSNNNLVHSGTSHWHGITLLRLQPYMT